MATDCTSRRSSEAAGRRFAACMAFVWLAGCTGLPSWLDERISGPSEGAAPIAYPDLARLPDPPAPPPTAEERADALQELGAARAANEAAAESLNQAIENDFEFPAASSN